jgi:flagellar biosynthesis/type III secretory pathway protein FliH
VLLPAQALADTSDALTLAQQCEERAEEVLAQAHEQARHEAAAGLRRVLEEAAARCAQRLLEIERERHADWQRRQQEVLDLVMLVLDRVAPSLARGELIGALVRQAVGEARQARRLLVKVAPDVAAGVRDEVAALRASCAWVESLEVVAAPQLEGDDCLIESPHGVIDAGWTTQLAAVRALLQAQAGEHEGSHEGAPHDHLRESTVRAENAA